MLNFHKFCVYNENCKNGFKNMIKIQINEIQYDVPKDLTIMEACKRIGVYIPSLCYHSDVPSGGNCGLCIVKVDGSSYTHACMMHVRPGMVINTIDKDIIEKQKNQFNNFINISHIPKTKDIEEVIQYFHPKKIMHIRQAEKTNAITFIPNACINCQICERVCADVIDVGALDDPTISIKNGKCISCGLCTSSCPTNAIIETNSIPAVLSSLVNNETDSFLIVDPSVIVSINDAFTANKSYGIECSEKIVGAAKMLGFKHVFDNRIANDFISLEMTEELIKRINLNSSLPMINSNCPAVINDIEKTIRELIPNLSAIKPPQHILARAIRKTFQKIKQEHIFIVHLTSCVTSKAQIKRMQLANDIDAALTAREFIQLINSFGIDWDTVKPSQFDAPFASVSGASSLTAISGGLTTTILRNVYEKNNSGKSSKEIEEYSYQIDHKGYNKIEFKTHDIKIHDNQDFQLKVAVCNGISALHQLIADNDTFKTLHFVEVMACPGGCIFGGGQPKISSKEFTIPRINTIISIDKNSSISSPHANMNEVEMRICFPLQGTFSNNKISTSATLNTISRFGNNKFSRISYSSTSKPGIKSILKPTIESPSHSISLSSFSNTNTNTTSSSNVVTTYNNVNNDNFHSIITTCYEPQESASYKKSRKNLSTVDLPLVAYGSSTGKAMRYARFVASFFKTSSSSLNSTEVEKIKLRKKILIIMSSHENGNFPSNAKKFVDELTKLPRDLSEVSYAILGIDDSKKNVNNFCQASQKLDELFSKLKAKPIIELSKLDISSQDGGDSSYYKWLSDLQEAMMIDKDTLAGMKLINEFKKVEDETVANKPSRPIGFEMAEISEKVLISPPDFSPKLTKVVIALPEGLTYELGDQVSILPCNDDDVVNSVIEALGYSKTDVFNVNSGNTIIPDKVTIQQLFTQYLDLNCIPPIAVYQTFYNNLVNEGGPNLEEGKKFFEQLLDDSSNKRKEFQTENCTADAIIEFCKFTKPPLDTLVSSINIMAPRIYSVSSSPDTSPDKAELLVNEVLFKSGSKQRYGLCTHFLIRPELSKVAIHFRRGKFRYPKDLTTDVVLIGLGSGLSPILPLVQLREKFMKEGKKLGKAILFFGARYRGSYQRLLSRIDGYQKNGAITESFLAFSRDPEKLHIQDVMKKNSEKIWDIWQDPRTCVFFSGPDKGIPDQLKDIFVDITIHEGWMAMEEAMAYNSRHEWHIEGL